MDWKMPAGLLTTAFCVGLRDKQKERDVHGAKSAPCRSRFSRDYRPSLVNRLSVASRLGRYRRTIAANASRVMRADPITNPASPDCRWRQAHSNTRSPVSDSSRREWSR
jgi:hypothetical protein